MCCGTSQIFPSKLVFLQPTTAPTEAMVRFPLVKAEFVPSIESPSFSACFPAMPSTTSYQLDRQVLTIEPEILQIKQHEETCDFPSQICRLAEQALSLPGGPQRPSCQPDHIFSHSLMFVCCGGSVSSWLAALTLYWSPLGAGALLHSDPGIPDALSPRVLFSITDSESNTSTRHLHN